MTYIGERDAAFTPRAVKVHIRSRDGTRKCARCRNDVEKEYSRMPEVRRRAAKCFASRGPEWLSPSKEEHDASLVPA